MVKSKKSNWSVIIGQLKGLQTVQQKQTRKSPAVKDGLASALLSLFLVVVGHTIVGRTQCQERTSRAVKLLLVNKHGLVVCSIHFLLVSAACVVTRSCDIFMVVNLFAPQNIQDVRAGQKEACNGPYLGLVVVVLIQN